MQDTPYQFVPVGFGNAIAVWRIVAVMTPSASAARRRCRQAKDKDRYIDMTFGRSVKSYLLQDDGSLVGCGITERTILSRIKLAITEESNEEKEDSV